MNLKIQALLLQLEAVTCVDMATLDRADLVRLSDASFKVTGEAELELEQRLGFTRLREDFQPN